MLCKTRAIVLHNLPYNDSYAIINMYTQAYGRVSYLVPRSRGKKSQLSKAVFMPLSVVELEADHQAKRDMQRIKEAKLCFPFIEIYANPVKNVIALFLAEVLYRVIKETEPDMRLFNYLQQSIHWLENADKGIANFHLVFLLGLPQYLGIFPHTDTYLRGSYFDLLNGQFVGRIPSHRHYLNSFESLIFTRLLKISYENMSLYAFSRNDRVYVIQRILEYYRLHLPEFHEIKSLEVMQRLFD